MLTCGNSIGIRIPTPPSPSRVPHDRVEEVLGMRELNLVKRRGHVLDLSSPDGVLLRCFAPGADRAGNAGEHVRGVVHREGVDVPGPR